MYCLKPFFKTIIFASFSFLLIVILGMKYHWVSLVFDENTKSEELISNEQLSNLVASKKPSIDTLMLSQAHAASNEQPVIFEPIIIDQKIEFPALKNMTKTQLTEKCRQLFFKLYNHSNQDKIFIGNCVISNFHEVFQETPVEHLIDAKNIETQRIKADEFCRAQQNNKQNLLWIEKELLIGICISKLI